MFAQRRRAPVGHAWDCGVASEFRALRCATWPFPAEIVRNRVDIVCARGASPVRAPWIDRNHKMLCFREKQSLDAASDPGGCHTADTFASMH